MNRSLQALLRAVTPSPLRTARARLLSRRRKALERRLYDAIGGRVVAGPFSGLLYGREAWGSTVGAKLLGTYEQELSPLTIEIARRAYPTIVNIGAAEGYYAVGLLQACPTSRVIAFEASPRGRELLGDLASRNEVESRLQIRGFCAPADLEAVLAELPNALVVCDVEGAEHQLLDPVTIPALRDADILVEVHDFIDPTISRVLLSRFAESHVTTRISTREQRNVPEVAGFTRRTLTSLAGEQRPARMEWFWMQRRPAARQGAAGGDGIA